MRTLRIIDKGTIEYGQAWDFQKGIFQQLLSGDSKESVLIWCEHPHVYTLGKSGDTDNLLINDDFLQKIGATYFKTDRGGDITYHGYGQIVGYPIINLETFGLGLKEYIHRVEEAVIRTVKGYGIEAFRSDGATGVWIKDTSGKESKICAIGVKASRFITMHGFALNVNTDLNYFNYINPCGFTDRGVTSLEQLTGAPQDMERVKQDLAEHLAVLLEADLQF